MRTDGMFSIYGTKLKCGVSDFVTLVPFGDVHWDSPAHAKETWEEFLYTARHYHNPFFIGMGDYMDGYSTSERRIIYSSDMHDSSRKREEVATRARVERFAEQIEFMKDRLILLGGNHFPVFKDGTTGDQYLANIMDAPYLGAAAAIRLCLEASVSNRTTLDIFAHHGKGGGITAGGRMNAVEKLQNVCEADIYLMGDNHARGTLPLGDRLRLEGGGKAGLRLTSRKQWIGRTGSFLKSYEPGESSYVVDAALAPASLGWIIFKLFVKTTPSPERKMYIDIRSEQ